MTVKYYQDPETGFYKFPQRNAKGEEIIIDIRPSTANLKLWKSFKYIPQDMKNHLVVDAYVTDLQGLCWSKYNPTIKKSEDGRRMVLNWPWILEDTPENRTKILNEIQRRRFRRSKA